MFYISYDKEKNTNFLENDEKKRYRKKTGYTYIKVNQITSIGTAIIPFLEHDDANRALMGSNMQKQAMPLNSKETAIVQTGLENMISKESTCINIAKKSGLIKYSSHNKIIIKEINLNKTNKILNLNKKMKIKKNLFKLLSFKYNTISKNKTYFLEENRKNNQNIYQKQESIVKKKEWIKKGKTISDNVNTKNSEFCIGKNLLVGYMSLDGYNFEDAIIINERLINENILTSIHIKKYKTFLVDNETGKVRRKN
jgi:DNA-directed RNA polymerase subunit beta